MLLGNETSIKEIAFSLGFKAMANYVPELQQLTNSANFQRAIILKVQPTTTRLLDLLISLPFHANQKV